VPAVMVSGPPGFYGINTKPTPPSITWWRRHPAECFIPLKHSGLSTRDEAVALLDELKRRGVHSFVLVTSNFPYTSARAVSFWISNAAEAGGPQIRMLARRIAISIPTRGGGRGKAARWRSLSGPKP